MAKKKGKSKARGTPKTTLRRSLPRDFPSHSRNPQSQIHEAISAVTQKFSLRDEARYMSNHRSSAFDSSKRLRHMPVAFVSAGRLEGTVKEKDSQLESPAVSTSPSVLPPPSRSPVATEALALMTIRSPSPTPSATSSMSSEEIVVFRGRAHMPPTHTAPPSRLTETGPAPSVAPVTPTQLLPADESACSNDTLHTKNTSSDVHAPLSADVAAPDIPHPSVILTGEGNAPPSHSEPEVDSDTNSVVDSHFQKRRGKKARWAGKETDWVSRSKPGIGWLPVHARPEMEAFVKGKVDPRDAAMDDYMENAAANDELRDMIAASGFARREMDLDGGSHNDWVSDGDLEIPAELEHDQGWDSDLARDLDALSTSTDVEGVVARIVGHRTRPRGLQYQVVYEGYTKDDPRWLPATYLKTSSDKLLVEAYEAKRLAREEQQMSSHSDSDCELDVDEESSEGSESESESEVDDEQLARAWQKQEEMGIDEDELVLYAADAYFDASNASRPVINRSHNRRQQRAGGGRRNDRVFPSASALADAVEMDPYGGFDIMDTERPSLRLKKKGRKGYMPPELLGDDSDLNEQLQSTWAADRAKKRLKKAEREELRKQGLLGRKGKAPDLSVKYKDGIIMEDIIEEIREFMASGMQTLSLPPMEAHRRAAIHQFVGEFNISSKSRGDGVGRFTILSKTSRTIAFDDEHFDQTIAQKRYNRRLLAQAFSRPSPIPRPKKEKGAKNRPTVSYKDGEVVGARAPELGVENKGRAMLEKMGWSKGMALGADDNKGILQPITHTVKITKAGLR